MRTSDIIENVSDRQVEGVVLVLACRNRNSSLITAEDDRYKESTLR